MVKDLSKKFKDSPYDSAGMPLGVDTVDYDKKEDVAAKTVTDKYIEPLPLFSDDDDFHEKHIKRRQYNESLNNTAIQFPGHKIHKAHEEDIATGLTDITDPPRKIDLEDPANGREELVRDALEKGHKEVSKLPDVAKKEEVDKILADEHNTDGAKDERDENPDYVNDEDNILSLLNKQDNENDGK